VPRFDDCMSNLSTDNIVAESTVPYLHLDLAGVDGVDPYSIGLGRALHLDRLSEQAYASLRGAIAG
jgi:hypothetical protein